MQKLNPTRINLITLKKRAGVAEKGHSILKRKREVLVIEFLKLLNQSKNDRSYLNDVMRSAYKIAITSNAFIGNFELEEAAMHVREAKPIRMEIKNIMGVRIPIIGKQPGNEPMHSYNLFSTSVAVDDIGSAFTKARESIIDIAQREQGLKRLVLEIDKTKRRVNALENVVIPGMISQAKYISMRLEEIDRDMFSALKHVKKKLSAS